MSHLEAASTSKAGGWSTGLIVGRFDPPHLGHSFMIEWAAQRCAQLVVFVNSSTSADTAPGDLRAGWLADLHPEVLVRQVRHQLWNDWEDEELWAQWMALFRSEWPLAAGPDVVFSSDGYVNEIARRFDAQSIVVDADRVTVPISATQIRESPADHLHQLAPPVRAWVEANWV
ncbi:MAG: adenylyltransferase/cytidyltransferase family protein [Ilumatobacter sp.]|nr:adenylyltransferase/cytidyltransferase family protein [Ilumatobacter sp.]